MSSTDLAEKCQSIIDACLRMNRLGTNQGTSGNISLRHKAGMLITPTSVPYEAMRPEQIVYMKLDGSFDPRQRPSSEWRFHLDILRARPEMNAVGACQWLRMKAFHMVRGHDEAFKMWCFEDMDFQRRTRWIGLQPVHLDEETTMLHQWHPPKDDLMKDPLHPQFKDRTEFLVVRRVAPAVVGEFHGDRAELRRHARGQLGNAPPPQGLGHRRGAPPQRRCPDARGGGADPRRGHDYP